VEISVLGPVEVSAGGQPVAIGAGKPRALLAMLALHEGSTLSTESLLEGLWGEQPPATAAKMVQLCVSQLRRALPDAGDGGWIVTRGRGYELRLSGGELDAHRFERLIAEGRPREALALWRGAPLADVADEPFAAAEIRRLEELRLTALEQAIDRDLAAGRHREVVGELQGLVAAEPLRERLHAQRMLALYRCGRQAEALDAYRQARRALVEQIGVEPGPELRRIQEAICARMCRWSRPAPRWPGCRSSSTRGRRWRAACPSLIGCASTGGQRTPVPAGWCWSPAGAGSARRGWRRSWRARCIATAAPCCTPRAPAWPRRRAPRSTARGAPDARRCWSSTTSTVPAASYALRSPSSSRGWPRWRCSSWRRARTARLPPSWAWRRR
jgi:DNA-binding SARP family transcriptional activator